jgi:ribosome biogenesis GTPase A
MWVSRRCSMRSLAGTRFVRLVHQARSASSFSPWMPQYSYLQQTKHFQTLFWTPEVRLVDCPGLVVPNLIPLELQVI